MAIYNRMTIKGRGGALPQYERQMPYAEGSGVSARVSGEAGRIVAEGNQAVAGARKNFAAQVFGAVDTGLTAYEEYAKAKATELITQYKQGMNQVLYGENGILTLQGEEAFNADEQRAAKADALRGQLLEGIGGSLVADIFGRFADDYDAETSLKAQRYQGEQFKVFRKRANGAAAAQAVDDALLQYRDKAAFEKSVATALYYQRQVLQQDGYGGEALERGLKETASKIYSSAIQTALAHDDVAGAQRLLAEGSKVYADADSARYMTGADIEESRLRIATRADALQRKAEAEQKKAEERVENSFVAIKSQEILKQLRDFDSREEQEARLAQLTADIEDKGTREKVRKAVKYDLAEQELQRKARTVLELDELEGMMVRPDGTMLTPSEQIAVIMQADISDDARTMALNGVYDVLNGKDNEAASAAGLVEYRRWFDAGGGRAGPEEARAKMLDLGLNSRDRKAAEEYRGVRLQYPQQHIFTLIDRVKGRSVKSDDTRNALYEAVIREARASGKTLTDKEIKEIIYKQAIRGRLAGDTSGWFGRPKKLTYEKAMTQTGGKMGLFRPEVPEATAKQIMLRLEEEQPWMTLLTDDMRAALVQTVYIQEQLGIALELSDKEAMAFQTAMNEYERREGAR